MNESLKRLEPQFGSPPDLAILDASAARIGFEVPGPLRELYQRGNGAKLPSVPAEILTLETATRIVQYKPLAHTVYFPWPFFEVQGYASDPVCLIVRGPGTGYVMQNCHDGSDRMIAPSIEAFFDWLASSPAVGDFFDEEDPSPLFVGAPDASTLEVVAAMMATAPTATDPYEAESLYDLVGSIVDDETYVDLFTREQISIQNYFACILSRARKMPPELRMRLDEMYAPLI